MRITVYSIVVSYALAWSATTHAQGSECVDGSPGSGNCPAISPVYGDGGEEQRPVSHHDFFLPNGHLTAPGKVSISVHEFGVYNTIAYGVSDRIEISASAPALPFIFSVGGRFALTSRDSPVRAVVGASVWMPLIQDDDDEVTYWAQLSATVAYQADEFNIHGTLSSLWDDDDGYFLPAANIGISYQIAPRYAFLANYASVNVGRSEFFCGSCSDPRLNVVLAGVKYMGRRWDVDLGLAIPTNAQGDSDTAGGPLVSFQRVY